MMKRLAPYGLCAMMLLFILPQSSQAFESYPGILLAQAEDDAFDPFSDYSEFDEATEEEADINFFRNGRFLTVGLQLGSRSFTDDLGSAYQAGSTYGLYLSYFFDLRFALQFTFSASDHAFSFSNSVGNSTSGNVSYSAISIVTKYYFNTQNVTKGLADLNPYMLIGTANNFRTYTVTSSVTGQVLNGTISAWGLDFGGGIEIPMMRKKAYFGFQGVLHYVSFADSNNKFVLFDYSNTLSTLTQKGYPYDIVGLVGVNF